MAAMTLLTTVPGYGGYDSSNDCTWVWRLQVWLMAMTVYGHHKPLARERRTNSSSVNDYLNSGSLLLLMWEGGAIVE